MACRGIRGATTAESNSPEDILSATRELLQALIAANGLDPADLAFAIFTVTPDLNAAFPAQAARELGWTGVPLLCAQEIDGPGALPRCIRILLCWNTERLPSEVVHVYMREARNLRPDLTGDV